MQCATNECECQVARKRVETCNLELRVRRYLAHSNKLLSTGVHTSFTTACRASASSTQARVMRESTPHSTRHVPTCSNPHNLVSPLAVFPTSKTITRVRVAVCVAYAADRTHVKQRASDALKIVWVETARTAKSSLQRDWRAPRSSLWL